MGTVTKLRVRLVLLAEKVGWGRGRQVLKADDRNFPGNLGLIKHVLDELNGTAPSTEMLVSSDGCTAWETGHSVGNPLEHIWEGKWEPACAPHVQLLMEIC